MKIIDTPFVKKVGIEETDGGELMLPFQKDVQNHLETVCAGAQYTLAESSSADLLQNIFPELVGKVIPVIRESTIKYKKPAQSKIRAQSSVKDNALQKFKDRFKATGRALISIDVKIFDSENDVTASGSYTWYLQRIETE
jgi:thioesterase domain-containing protein